ncbi:MAG: MFS transporter [Chloroflexia bacterium]
MVGRLAVSSVPATSREPRRRGDRHTRDGAGADRPTVARSTRGARAARRWDGNAAYALGAAHLPRESRGATFGLLSTGMMVGGGLSPFVAGLLAAVDIRLVFIVGGGVYALSAIVSLRLPRPPSTAAEEATLRDAAPA